MSENSAKVAYDAETGLRNGVESVCEKFEEKNISSHAASKMCDYINKVSTFNITSNVIKTEAHNGKCYFIEYV